MWKLFKILLAGIAVSFYFFPFEFTFLPGVNTKMAMAAIGMVIVLFNFLKDKEAHVPKDILFTSLYAIAISVIGLISVVYNHTPDFVYTSYIISMLVWLSSAFTVVTIIKFVHKSVSAKLICDYLVAVCVAQCFLAQIIDTSPSFKRLVDLYVSQGQIFLNEVDRLYGIGASLDVAGSRFSAVLICLVLVTSVEPLVSKTRLWMSVCAFLIIGVLGSMIARTTYVGVVLCLIYISLSFKIFKLKISSSKIRVAGIVLILVMLFLPVVIKFYYGDTNVQKMLRFAFEGFFNLVETGEWSIASNEKLKTMYVLPESLKTWIIGDGYFNNPINVDPYYVGEITGGYYKGTDVGYLRFIFYFGITGLLAFMLFFIKVAKLCKRGLTHYKSIFVFLLLANFVIWFKVSTDIFLVFALFLCVANMQDETPQLEEEEV